MYVSLDKKYLEKTKDEASKRYISSYGDEEKILLNKKI